MVKRVQIKILPDGSIEAVTQGIKGKACLEYVHLLEELLDAKVVDSNFTSEYNEIEERFTETNQEQILDQNS